MNRLIFIAKHVTVVRESKKVVFYMVLTDNKWNPVKFLFINT